MSATYRTRDGLFEIAQDANGWMVRWVAPDPDRHLEAILVLSGCDRYFRRLRDARERLDGAVYARPDGWLHQPMNVTLAEYRRMIRPHDNPEYAARLR